ncbi:tyrosine-type recombinase/integrase [Cupriavidus basilensis]
MDAPDKVDKDDDEAVKAKSLKTVNSQRSVPLHSAVLKLGFIEYCEALRAAGYRRLFPELLHDAVRGYGKAATQWFGRFLGNQLKMERNGRKVFHSFRHTFITALFAADIPDATVSQLSGHAQEGSEAAIRYRKDQSADQLRPYVERLAFDLPDIAPFEVAAGMAALKDALDAKQKPDPATGSEGT